MPSSMFTCHSLSTIYKVQILLLGRRTARNEVMLFYSYKFYKEYFYLDKKWRRTNIPCNEQVAAAP